MRLITGMIVANVNDIRIQNLDFSAGWKNIRMQVGRSNLLWGQGENGGLMLSSNARGLDSIIIQNPYPWHIKYIGNLKFNLFVSTLGPHREYPWSYFYGMKFSWRPCRYFEFGLSETVITGGDGAPKLKWWEPIAELFPFHKWGGSNVGTTDLSNHAFGFFDMRITIPQLRGLVMYYDAYIEDSITRAFRLPDNLMNQMSFVTGVYLPRLDYDGQYGLRLEYHHIAPLTYRHGNWTTGYTLDQRPMGDPLGPTSDGGYATFSWLPSYKMEGNFDLAVENYSSSTYYTETSPQGYGDRIRVASNGPSEWRVRGVGSLSYLLYGNCKISFAAGYEYIKNWNFIVGKDVNNMLARMKVSLYFDNLKISSRHAKEN